jgi:hypothetical protein
LPRKGLQKLSLFGRIRRRILQEALNYETLKGDHFLTIRARPKRSASIGLCAASSPKYSTQPVLCRQATGIVMQGPVWAEDDFTIETLRLYRRAMPDCKIILSTWEDTPEAQLAPIAALGVDIVLNDKPDRPGPFNVNMQIASAAGGMRRAEALGVEWVLKTRTDQRLHHPTFMSGLIALAELLPPSGLAAEGQKCRIFGLGQGTLKFVPYHLSDQTVFGNIIDMLAYWSPPFREDGPPDDFPSDPYLMFRQPIGRLCRHGTPETYFASQFLMRQGRNLDWTIADSWAAFRDHFGVVDQWSSDFYWVKGQTITMRDGIGSYAALTNAKELTFLEWAELRSGALLPEAAEAYEWVLEEPTTVFEPGYP